MIHIATVHALFDRWVQERLNFLADVILEQGDDEDVLVFLDGDAFPIHNIAKPIASMLERSPLAAIRRDENLELHPHPAFCATTVGFWRRIEGDWRGVEMSGVQANLSDQELKRLGWKAKVWGRGWVKGPGGKLQEILLDRRIEWMPLLRTNTRNIHPLLFGIYGNLIYHHGEGFRGSLTSKDRAQVLKSAFQRSPRTSNKNQLRSGRGARSSGPPEAEERNKRLDSLVFEMIKTDDHFYRELFFP